MAFVYKPVVTYRKDGRKRRRRSRFYWASYDRPDGKPKRKALKLPNGRGVTDREVARAGLRKLLKRLGREAAGLVDPTLNAARLPTRVVLARFARYLRGRRRSVIHVRKTIRRVKWLCETGEMPRLAEVNAANTDKALRVLSDRNRAPKTINEYRAALFGMCQWAVKVERLLSANPLESVAVQETAGDVRKVRRALTPDEAARLLAKSGPRALWYETALFTGLRVGELRKLEWRDVALDVPQPHIRLRAATTKARREDVVPLRRALAGKLSAAKPRFAKPTDRAFKTTPTRTTFRNDCDRAGIRWQPDDRGRTLDRHALRTTYCTWLSRSGTAPRVAQMLARHTDIRLTMRNYTDPALLDGWAAVENLPDLKDPNAEKLRATGTDNAVVLPVVLNSGECGRTDVNASGTELRQAPAP